MLCDIYDAKGAWGICHGWQCRTKSIAHAYIRHGWWPAHGWLCHKDGLGTFWWGQKLAAPHRPRAILLAFVTFIAPAGVSCPSGYFLPFGIILPLSRFLALRGLFALRGILSLLGFLALRGLHELMSSGGDWRQLKSKSVCWIDYSEPTSKRIVVSRRLSKPSMAGWRLLTG